MKLGPAKADAAASLKVFYEPKSGPLRERELRSKTCRLAAILGNESEPGGVWHLRWSEYWQRQGQMYGFEPSNIAISTIVDPVVGPCITSWCVVKRLLPGRRVKRHLLSEQDRIQ